jgi:hypothetical protein
MNTVEHYWTLYWTCLEDSVREATHVGLAAGLFASLLKNGEEVVVGAGRAPAAARAIKVGTVEASTIPHDSTIALRRILWFFDISIYTYIIDIIYIYIY